MFEFGSENEPGRRITFADIAKFGRSLDAAANFKQMAREANLLEPCNITRDDKEMKKEEEKS